MDVISAAAVATSDSTATGAIATVETAAEALIRSRKS
jgi:hypothetical protein